MTRTIVYELSSSRRAGPVTGTLTAKLEGEPDALAAVERDLAAHLLAAPGCKVVPAVVETPESPAATCVANGNYTVFMPGTIKLNGSTCPE